MFGREGRWLDAVHSNGKYMYSCVWSLAADLGDLGYAARPSWPSPRGGGQADWTKRCAYWITP